MPRLLKDIKFLKILCVVIVVVLVYFFFLSRLGFFEIAKLKAIDALYRASHFFKPDHENIDKIVIISIDERSFDAINKKWPWPRMMFADLIDKVSTYKPRLICFDFAFVGESENKDNDLAFSESMKRAGNVIIASLFDNDGRYVIPQEELAVSSLAYGFINKPRDWDYYVRRARIVYPSRNAGIVDLSFELKTILEYLGIGAKDVLYDSKRSIVRMPKKGDPQGYVDFTIHKDGTIPINYSARPGEFKVIPFVSVINESLPADTFKDKIVLVSLTSEIFHDIYNTPLGVMPGVAIVGNEVLMFLNNNFIKEVPTSINFLILVILTVFTALVVYKYSAIKGLLFSALALIFFISLSIYLFRQNYWADYFSPIFFILISHMSLGTYKYIQLLLESANLKTLAITDGLTGLFVHRYFMVRMQNEFDRSLRYNVELSLAILDIDHFKNINDTYGHQQGDFVLKTISGIMQLTTRKVDILSRYGGEEFCIILPHTNQEGALKLAERLRNSIATSEFKVIKSDKAMKITASIGIASYKNVHPKTIEDFIKAADTALYDAKNSGRNKTCVSNMKFNDKTE